MSFSRFSLLFLFQCLFAVSVFSQYNFKAYLEEAKGDVKNKNYTEAIQKLNVCLQVKPAECEASFYRGVSKYFLNDNIGAQQDLDNAVTRFSQVYYDAFHFRALVKDRLEDYQGAIADYSKILEKYNTDPQLFVERAFCKMSSHDYNGAIADCNKAITLQPAGVKVATEDLYLCRGAAENALNEFEKALDDFDNAIAVNPKNENAYVRKGITRHKMGKYEEALAEYNKAIKLDSGCTFAYYNRAETKIQLNDKKGALQDYNSLIKYEATNAAAYFNRAALQADMARYKDAIADFDKVLQLNPENIEAILYRAKLKEQVRDFKGALADYNKCIELFPYFVEAYYDMSQLKKSLNDFEGAKKDYETGRLMSEMNHTKSGTQLAHDSITIAHLSALTADFDNVNPSQPDTVTIEMLPIYFIASADTGIKNTANRRPLFLKTSKQLYTRFCLTNKELPANNGIADSSFSALREVKKTNNNGLEGLLKTALEKTRLQLFNDAIKDYDKIISLYPNSAVAYFARGVNACREVELLSQFNDSPAFLNQKKAKGINQRDEIFQKALYDFNKAVQLEPSFAEAYYNRAFVKCQLQDFNGTVKDYDNAIQADADLGDAYYNRGLFLLHLNDKIDACKDFSKAGELGLSESYLVIKKYCPR